MQLDLFQWDSLAVGNGYRCLAGLNFSQARIHFNNVCKMLPEHHLAGQGLRDLEFWEEAFAALHGLAPEAAVRFLWEKISAFSFGGTEGYRTLRRSLLQQLLSCMDGLDDLYIPPDLCRGYLHLQLGEHAAAIPALRSLLARLPANGRLHCFLAEALWGEGLGEEAGAAWVAALLLAPAEFNATTVGNHRLDDLIREHGPPLAPVYGYLAGILPLVDQKTSPTTPEAGTYALLYQAEQARFRSDHHAMVSARRALKENNPEVLRDYLAWLTTTETGP